MTSTTKPPTAVRLLDSPAALALADLAAMLDELQTVLRCCDRLLTELDDANGEADDLVLESVWTTALLSYQRCFADGRSGQGLTEDDVKALPLQGEVGEWHQVLRQLREHYADAAANPRERFSVGASQDSRGRADAIAITSVPQPRLDDRTVRQTGAVAYELYRLVDQRAAEHQQRLLAAAHAMSQDELDRLPRIDVAGG